MTLLRTQGLTDVSMDRMSVYRVVGLGRFYCTNKLHCLMVFRASGLFRTSYFSYLGWFVPAPFIRAANCSNHLKNSAYVQTDKYNIYKYMHNLK